MNQAIKSRLDNMKADARRCGQCGREMTPLDYMVGPVCMKCCKANHKKAAGR